MIPIATQTETQRKAAAEKAAATRRENEARRSRSSERAAEARAKAQGNRLRAAAYQAQRVGDAAIGAGLSAGESVAGAVQPWRENPTRQFEQLRTRLNDGAKKAERRGARARKHATREVTRRRYSAMRTLRRSRPEIA